VRTGFALMLGIVLLTTAVELRAQGSESLDEMVSWAEAAEADLEYDRALELWNTVIAHPDVTSEQRLEASVHAGSIERIRGNQLQARVHFMYVLDQDIDYLLPADTEPKIASFFEMVRAEMREKARAQQGGAETGSQTSDDGESVSGGPGMLAYAGGAALAGAVIAGGLAATAGVLSDQAQTEAMGSTVQVYRVASYDDRDLFAMLANGGWAVSGGLLLVGAALLVVDLLSGDPAQ